MAKLYRVNEGEVVLGVCTGLVVKGVA